MKNKSNNATATATATPKANEPLTRVFLLLFGSGEQKKTERFG